MCSSLMTSPTCLNISAKTLRFQSTSTYTQCTMIGIAMHSKVTQSRLLQRVLMASNGSSECRDSPRQFGGRGSKRGYVISCRIVICCSRCCCSCCNGSTHELMPMVLVFLLFGCGTAAAICRRHHCFQSAAAIVMLRG